MSNRFTNKEPDSVLAPGAPARPAPVSLETPSVARVNQPVAEAHDGAKQCRPVISTLPYTPTTKRRPIVAEPYRPNQHSNVIEPAVVRCGTGGVSIAAPQPKVRAL